MVLPTNPFTSRHLGISLSPNGLHALLMSGASSPKATAEQRFSVPIIDTKVTQPDTLVQALKGVKQGVGFQGNYAAVCIPEKFAFSRQHLLPDLALNELDEAITWQLEKIFPFPSQEIYADWKIIDRSNKETKVMVTAIPRVLLDSVKECFEAAGLYPVSFEPSASALARLATGPRSGQTLIILEIEAQGTAATLIQHGISTFTTTTIFNHTTPAQTVLSDITNNLTTLVKRTINPSVTPAPVNIILTGEKASSSLAQVIQKAINQPTTQLEVSGVTPTYHLAYAAATATVLPPEDTTSINLLPTQLQAYYRANIHHQQAWRSLKLSLMICLISVFTALGGFIIAFLSTRSLTSQIAVLEQSVNTSQVEGVNIAQLSQQAQRFTLLFPKKTSPEATIGTVLSALPPGITVSSLTISPADATITLSGVAGSRSAMLALKEGLDDLDLFTKIVIPLSALENNTNYPFTLTFTLKP